MTARPVALVLAAALVAGACDTTVPPPSASAAATRAAQGTAVPATSGDPPGTGPVPSDAPAHPGVPADIAADVDALLGASSFEAAVAATRTILEKSGVVITEDPSSVPPTAAGLYLSDLELRHIADEGRNASTVARLSFADFASAFGGAALLPPNDALIAQFAELDFSVPEGAPDPSASPAPPRTPAPGETPPPMAPAGLDQSALPGRMATFLSGWVAIAAEQRATSVEPELLALTAPPLYLQALAARQLEPVDLRAPFAPDSLRLGSLQLALLTAGMRATLNYAQAETAAAVPGGPMLASTRLAGPAIRVMPAVTFSDCDQLKRLLDAHVPLSTLIGLETKPFIKDMVKGFITGLFGAGTAVAQFVGPAFTAIGLLFRVAALVLLYEHARADLTLEPAFVHKPDGQPSVASARLTAGIPDAEWERAKQERANDPWTTALRTCARLLGIPVTSDTVDVSESLKQWVVRWEITQGVGIHARLPREELQDPGFVASRLERPLRPINDHTSGDILALQIQPERLSDHPGDEQTAPVTVCARVVPRQPPGGFKTILSAGFAGESLASGGGLSVSSLAGLIGELLTSWYRELSTIDACASMSVSYHVPVATEWRGRVTVEYVSRSEETTASSQIAGWGSGPFGEPALGLSTKKRSTQVTETFYIGGTEEAGSPGYVPMRGRSGTQGFLSVFDYQWENAWTSACHYEREYIEDGSGSWWFEADVTGTILLYGDGRYDISLNGLRNPGEVTIPSHQEEEIVNLGSDRCTPHPDDGDLPLFVPQVTARGDQITGQLDPANPGTRLVGSQTTVWDEDSYSVVTWDLTHEGPIRLPFQQ